MNDRFLKLKTNLELNDSFSKIIEARHTAIRSAIQNVNPAIKDTKLIGSLQRQTRIQPRPDDIFDIDILVVMGSFVGWVPANDPSGLSTAAAHAVLQKTVEASKRYSEKDPTPDAPTITITFDDNTKAELVPAYVDDIGYSADGTTHSPRGRAYWVPKSSGWELADYDFEADYISRQNALTQGVLVPTIKMLKAIKRLHFPTFGSFHLELVAAQVIPVAIEKSKLIGEPITYSGLMRDFFIIGKDHLAAPVRAPGSHSPLINHGLIPAISTGAKFEEIKNHILRIPYLSAEAERVNAWRALFGDAFPITL